MIGVSKNARRLACGKPNTFESVERKRSEMIGLEMAGNREIALHVGNE
jgi:hypothetical protein